MVYMVCIHIEYGICMYRSEIPAKAEWKLILHSLSSVYIYIYTMAMVEVFYRSGMLFHDILETAEGENHRECRSGRGSTNGNAELFNRT